MWARIKSYHIARFLLVFINFLTLLFIVWVVSKTTDLICIQNDARTILERIKAVPIQPIKASWSVTLLYFLLIGSIIVREVLYEDINKSLLIVLSFIELIISIIILEVINFSFKYILLVPIANGITYLPDKYWKTFFTAIVVLCFVFIDYQIISIAFSIFSIEDFIYYHPSLSRSYILGFRNILFFISESLFITFIVLELQNVIEESQRIKNLNKELKEHKEKLEFANIQLQNYAERIEEIAKIKERNRLAREIHDTVGHYLTGIALGLSATEELIKKGSQFVLDQIQRLKDLAQQGLVDIRRSLKELKPDMLEKGNLEKALHHLVNEINLSTTRQIKLQISGSLNKLNPQIDETIYRIIQESITNAVRHGDAMNIEIGIDVDENGVHVSVIDDGKGAEKIVEGFGLYYMKQRILDHDGFLEIETEPGKGMSLSVYIPSVRVKHDD
jgi:signal transduction histidine kinase